MKLKFFVGMTLCMSANTSFADEYIHNFSGKAHKNIDHLVPVTLYGQAEKMVLVYDDGVDSNTSITDNSLGGTLIGVEADKHLDNGLDVSLLIEYSLSGSTSDSIQQGQSSSPGDLNEEATIIGLNGDYGGIFIGKQAMAADGVTKVDLDNLTNLLVSEVTLVGGNLKFRDKNNNLTSFTVSEVLTNNDSENLIHGIKYNSPVINGIYFSYSIENNQNNEVALFYNKDFANFSVSSAVGFKFINDKSSASSLYDNNIIKGSVNIKHSSGLSYSMSYGELNRENNKNVQSIYSKISYEFGSYSIGADFAQSKNFLTTLNNSTSTSVGMASNFNLIEGVSVGALFRKYSLTDKSSQSYNDINIVALNLAVTF